MHLNDLFDIRRTCDYVVRNEYSKVTLQFPDHMLHDAPVVADTLQSQLAAHGSAAKVYVLADTSYNPLSIDEVAAAHVNADCVIHYGYASLNPVSRTPALCVLPKAQLDVQQCSTWVAQQLASQGEQLLAKNSDSEQLNTEQHAVVCCDQSYLYLLPQLQDAIRLAYQGPLQLVFAKSAPVELKPQTSSAAAAAREGCSSSTCCQASAPQVQQLQQPQAAACTNTACMAGAPAADDDCCSQQGQQDTPKESTTGCIHHSTSQSATSPSGSSSCSPPVGGLTWQLPSSDDRSSNMCSSQQPLMLWLGPFHSPALNHLQLTYSTQPWLLLDPSTHETHQGLLPELQRLLKRRYYLVERVRAATMVGLLVGTLGAAGYLQALNKLRQLAGKAGKKTYTLLMGKPNPAKLANFPEIEVFVMLADPQGLILDSKEYLNPIVTPHEAYLAFTGKPFDQTTYRLDFEDLLQDAQEQQPQHAKAGAGLGGNITGDTDSDVDDGVQEDNADLGAAPGILAIAGSSSNSKAMTAGLGSRTGQQVQVHSAAQYLLQQRTYRGLETPATGGEILAPEKAVAGRSGRAAVYEDEPTV